MPSLIWAEKRRHMKRWNVNLIEDWLLQAFLVGAVATSIILSAIGVDVKWYIPAIFAVLYIIVTGQVSWLIELIALGIGAVDPLIREGWLARPELG
jgi:hypothetical protein